MKTRARRRKLVGNYSNVARERAKTLYLSECKTLDDFEALAAKASNMLEAEDIIRRASKVCGGDNSSWRRNFLACNFKRFEGTKMYGILMGNVIGDKREYHYVPNPL